MKTQTMVEKNIESENSQENGEAQKDSKASGSEEESTADVNNILTVDVER